MTQLTQVERVVAAARSFRGVCQVDFLAPDVVDNGKPITRLAARLWDAEQQGFEFECIGKRSGCNVYRLVSEPDVERRVDRPSPSSGSEGLTTPQQVDASLSAVAPNRALSPYEYEREVA
jgi:hypothetical protein